MAVTKYTKMIDNNGEVQSVEESRVERFLDEGWTIEGKQPKSEKKVTKSKSSKNKISVDAQVTSKASEEEVSNAEPTEEELEAVPCISCGSDEHSYKDCGEDNWTFSEDDFETAKKED